MYHKEFRETSDDIFLILENLYENSCKDYFNNVENECDCFEIRRDLIKINRFTTYLEEYIHSLKQLDYIKDLKEVLLKIKELKSLSILPKLSRDKKIIRDKYYIRLDPTLKEEEHRLFIYNELSNYLHKNWLEDVNYCIQTINSIKTIKTIPENNYYIEQAFNLLDNACSISTTENISSYITNNDKLVNNQYTFKNQEDIKKAADYFGTSLNYDEDNTLKHMSKDSLRDDFVRKIVSKSRYSLKGDKDLYKILVSLGKINEANKNLNNENDIYNNNDKTENFLNHLIEVVDENKKYIKFKK